MEEMVDAVRAVLALVIMISSSVGLFFGVVSWGRASDERHIARHHGVRHRMATARLRTQVLRSIGLVILVIMTVVFFTPWPSGVVRSLFFITGITVIALSVSLDTFLDYRADRTISREIVREITRRAAEEIVEYENHIETQEKPPPSPEGEDGGL